jgi:hypothetical protein
MAWWWGSSDRACACKHEVLRLNSLTAQKKAYCDWGCCSVIEHLPTMCEALASIPSIEEKKKANDDKSL